MRKIYCDYCGCEITKDSVHNISIFRDNKNTMNWELCDKYTEGVIINLDFSKVENKEIDKK